MNRFFVWTIACLMFVVLSACATVVHPHRHARPPVHAKVWVPGHLNPLGVWIPGHWKRR